MMSFLNRYILFSILFDLPFFAFSQWNSGTITLDGDNNESAYVHYGDWSMAWDNAYLYIVKRGGQTVHPVVLYFDFNQNISPVDGSDAKGSLIGETDHGVTPRLPFRAQFRIYWTYTYADYRQNDSSGGWGTNYSISASDRAYNSSINTNRELRLSWTSIFGLAGLPKSFRFVGYQINVAKNSQGVIYHNVPNGNPENSYFATPNCEYYYRVTNTDSANIVNPFSRRNYTFRGAAGSSVGYISNIFDFTHYQGDTLRKNGKWEYYGNFIIQGEEAVVQCIDPDSLLVGDSLIIVEGTLLLGDSLTRLIVDKNLSNYDTLKGCTRSVNQIQVKGDVRNYGVLRMDSSSLVLNRTATAQTILGNFAGNNALFRLEINNPDGVIESATDSLAIRNRLTLTDGILKANGRLVLRNGANISPVGGSADSYIDSSFFWHRYNSDTCIMPLGCYGEFAPIGLDPSNTVTGRIYEGKYSNKGFGNYTLKSGSDLDHVSYLEFWEVDVFGVSSSAADSATKITLYWRDFSDVGNSTSIRDSLRVAHFDGSEWEMTDNTPTIYDGGNSFGWVKSSAAVTTFSPFTLSTTSANNPLPVHLISFNGELDQMSNSVNLFWTTASEHNCKSFKIYRDHQDKASFLGHLDCQSFSNQINSYTFTDLNPLMQHYYWLKQIDLDGSYQWYGPVYISRNPKISLYPNPCRIGEFIQINDMEPIKTIKMFDLTGRKIEIELNQKNQIGTSHLSKSIYFVQIYFQNGKTQHLKIQLF